ncbi:3'(2'),5'-bisphosphate nucleotidase CysQ [Methanococcoides orientis]|uniref:3'(2'),5'-bisphosphate nucleotidase CysQ n=1 Tax=Methanococcoides orientis TaxID=2822137 RepID=UPI001E4E911E|nr:3'(2'),5'-bisphosphate nucleotidase CysQ [Methanococcoides orientis]UGV40313.1 3'(2'),5'-bisphosphate nucleotidase CysQ [Methanococcoides orientis]
MDENTFPKMLVELIDISRNAGKIILNYYNDSRKCIEIKEDNSPLTKADLESDKYIATRLKELYDIPIVSEENYPDHNVRKDYTDLFFVDPLDGTKEFIEGNGEFTVNIAYVKNNKPVMGVIYTPVTKTTFFAAEDFGSYMEDPEGIKELPLCETKSDILTATGSRKHATSLDSEFMQMNNVDQVVPAGSSLKFCKVAMGHAHLYPRFQGSMEWDIAAGHIIAKEAGCKLLDLKTMKEPEYNKESLLNNYFITFGPGIDISSIDIPEMS